MTNSVSALLHFNALTIFWMGKLWQIDGHNYQIHQCFLTTTFCAIQCIKGCQYEWTFLAESYHYKCENCCCILLYSYNYLAIAFALSLLKSSNGICKLCLMACFVVSYSVYSSYKIKPDSLFIFPAFIVDIA